MMKEAALATQVSSDEFRSATAMPELWSRIGSFCSLPTQGILRSANVMLSALPHRPSTATLYFIEKIQKELPLKFIFQNLDLQTTIMYPEEVTPDEIINECIRLLIDILLSQKYKPKQVNVVSPRLTEVLRLNQDNPILRFFEIIINPVRKTNSALAIYSLWKTGVNNIYFLKTDTLPEIKDIQMSLLNVSALNNLYYILLSCKDNPAWNLMFVLNYSRTINFVEKVVEFIHRNQLPVKARIILLSLALYNMSFLILFEKNFDLFCSILKNIALSGIELLRKKFIFNCLVFYLHRRPCDLTVEDFLDKFKKLTEDGQLDCLRQLKSGMSAQSFFQRNRSIQISFKLEQPLQSKRDRRERGDEKRPAKAVRANPFFEVGHMIPRNSFPVDASNNMNITNTLG